MKIFGQLIRTVVNVAVLPLAVVRDVVMAPVDAADNTLAPATRKQIEKIKDEAGEDA